MEIHSIEIPAALLLDPPALPVPDAKTASAEDFARFTLALAEQLEGYRCRMAAITAIVKGEKAGKKCSR